MPSIHNIKQTPSREWSRNTLASSVQLKVEGKAFETASLCFLLFLGGCSLLPFPYATLCTTRHYVLTHPCLLSATLDEQQTEVVIRRPLETQHYNWQLGKGQITTSITSVESLHVYPPAPPISNTRHDQQ